MHQQQVYDIETFDLVEGTLGFSFEVQNPDGSDQDPIAYYDLTGKELFFRITGNYPTPFELSSVDGPNANGSVLEVTDEEGGQVTLTITGTDIESASKVNGKYFIAMKVAGEFVPPILLTWTFKIVSLNAGGTV